MELTAVLEPLRTMATQVVSGSRTSSTVSAPMVENGLARGCAMRASSPSRIATSGTAVEIVRTATSDFQMGDATTLPHNDLVDRLAVDAPAPVTAPCPFSELDRADRAVHTLKLPQSGYAFDLHHLLPSPRACRDELFAFARGDRDLFPVVVTGTSSN